jgi:hypothetical protein
MIKEKWPKLTVKELHELQMRFNRDWQKGIELYVPGYKGGPSGDIVLHMIEMGWRPKRR